MTISSDNVPMPLSKGQTSRGNSRLSEGIQSDCHQLAPQTLNTVLHTSKGNTLDSQKLNLFQTQMDALHSTVSMIVERLDKVASTVRHSAGIFDQEQVSIHRSESLIKEVRTSLEAKLIQNSQKLLDKIEKHDQKLEELEHDLRALQGGGKLAEQRSLETSFINTISNVSIPRDAQQSASHHRTLSKTRNKSRQELTSAQHNYSVTSLKNKAGIEDHVKQLIESMNLVERQEAKDQVDKLGEEIAFDINNIESNLKKFQFSLDEVSSRCTALEAGRMDHSHRLRFAKRDSLQGGPSVSSQAETKKEKSLSQVRVDERVKQFVRTAVSDLKY